MTTQSKNLVEITPGQKIRSNGQTYVVTEGASLPAELTTPKPTKPTKIGYVCPAEPCRAEQARLLKEAGARSRPYVLWVAGVDVETIGPPSCPVCGQPTVSGDDIGAIKKRNTKHSNLTGEN